jgi:Domain of unknown function (DUF4265)
MRWQDPAMPGESKDSEKVRFLLDAEDDDWPPVASEGVWAQAVGDDEYELENVPWFARNVAYGDRVRIERDDDGVAWVQERLAWSGRYTIRVIPLQGGSSQERVDRVVNSFVPLGAECESALPAYRIVALDIPSSARVGEIKALLQRGSDAGWWEYEEGCIDEHWAAL